MKEIYINAITINNSEGISNQNKLSTIIIRAFSDVYMAVLRFVV